MAGNDHEPIRQEAMSRLSQAIAFLDELYERWLEGDLTDVQNDELTKVRDDIAQARVRLGEIDLRKQS